jgi:hypothetical protein
VVPGVQATQEPSRHAGVAPIQVPANHAPWLEHSSGVVVEPGRQRVASGLQSPTHFPSLHRPGHSLSSTNVPALQICTFDKPSHCAVPSVQLSTHSPASHWASQTVNCQTPSTQVLAWPASQAFTPSSQSLHAPSMQPKAQPAEVACQVPSALHDSGTSPRQRRSFAVQVEPAPASPPAPASAPAAPVAPASAPTPPLPPLVVEAPPRPPLAESPPSPMLAPPVCPTPLVPAPEAAKSRFTSLQLAKRQTTAARESRTLEMLTFRS